MDLTEANSLEGATDDQQALAEGRGRTKQVPRVAETGDLSDRKGTVSSRWTHMSIKCYQPLRTPQTCTKPEEITHSRAAIATATWCEQLDGIAGVEFERHLVEQRQSGAFVPRRP